MYDAFLSYSRTEDGALAPILQDALQRFAKPWYRRRALRIFRDDANLSANPALWSSITNALDESEWFVLLASPESARSEWVRREVEYWLQHRDRMRLLPVVTGGEWVWDRAADDFDWERSTAVPDVLRGAFAEEPRHVDLRWTRTEHDLSPRTPALREAVADIAAPMRGLAKDELMGEDLREHRRTVRTARLAVVVLLALFAAAVVGAVFAVGNARDAEAKSRLASRARDESDYQRILAQARSTRDKDRELALLLAVEARHARDTPESRSALLAALFADPRYLGVIAETTSSTQRFADLCLLQGDRVALTTGVDGTVGFFDLARRRSLGRRIQLTADRSNASDTGVLPDSQITCAISRDGAVAVIASRGGEIWSMDTAHRSVVPRPRSTRRINHITLSPNGRVAAAGTTDGRVLIWSGANTLPREIPSGSQAVGVAFSPDGTTLAATTSDEITLWNTRTWLPVGHVPDSPLTAQSGGLVVLPEPDRDLEFTADGKSLVDSRRGGVRSFAIDTGAVQLTRRQNLVGAATISVSTTDQLVAIEDVQGAIALVDPVTGTDVAPPMRSQFYSAALAFSRDGSTLVTSLYARPAISRWSLDGHSPISRVIARPGESPLSYSPDGRSLLTISADLFVGPTDAWDTGTGRHIGSVPNAAFPTILDDHTVAGYFVDELAVDRIDLRSNRRVGPKFVVPLSGVVQAASDLDGRVLVGHSDGTITQYAPDGKEVGHPWSKGDGYPFVMDVSSKAGLAAVETPLGSTIFHLADATPAFPRFTQLHSPQFSEDGKLVGGTTDDNQLVIIDTTRGVRSGAAAPTDGSTLYVSIARAHFIAGLGDTNAQLFDFASHVPVGDPFESTAPPVLRSDGLQLATANSQGVVLWDLDADHWERAACGVAGRDLTAGEWTKYFPNAGPYHSTCKGVG